VADSAATPVLVSVSVVDAGAAASDLASAGDLVGVGGSGIPIGRTTRIPISGTIPG